MPINDPTKFVTSYTGDSNNITLPVASLNDGLVDVNDIKEEFMHFLRKFLMFI